MPETSRRGWKYPARRERAWFETFEALLNQQDVDVYAALESASFRLISTGVMSYNSATGVLSWTDDLLLVSPFQGGQVLIAGPGSLSGVSAGKIVYVVVSRPMINVVNGSLVVGDTLGANENRVLVAANVGGKLYVRDDVIAPPGQMVMPSVVHTSANVASGGGSLDGEIDVGLSKAMLLRSTVLSNGGSLLTTISFYRDAARTDLIKSWVAIDCSTEYALVGAEGVLFGGVLAAGKVYYRVINNGASNSTYTFAVNAMGDKA